MWFLLFIKQLPVMAMAEIKEIVLPRMRRLPHTTGHGTEEAGFANPSLTDTSAGGAQ